MRKGEGHSVAAICQVLGIPDVNEEIVTKQEVMQAIKVKEKKKLDSIKDEDFRIVIPPISGWLSK